MVIDNQKHISSDFLEALLSKYSINMIQYEYFCFMTIFLPNAYGEAPSPCAPAGGRHSRTVMQLRAACSSEADD